MRKTQLHPASAVIAWLFLVAGTVGFFYHAPEIWAERRFHFDAVGVCLVRLLAVAGAVLLLRGFSWARWVLLGWMAFHVVLSFFHSLDQLITHVIFLVVIAFFLLPRPKLRRVES